MPAELLYEAAVRGCRKRGYLLRGVLLHSSRYDARAQASAYVSLLMRKAPTVASQNNDSERILRVAWLTTKARARFFQDFRGDAKSSIFELLFSWRTSSSWRTASWTTTSNGSPPTSRSQRFGEPPPAWCRAAHPPPPRAVARVGPYPFESSLGDRP